MNEPKAHYSGAGGDAYLAQRQGAASDHNQALRATLFADLGGADKTVLDFGCGTGGVVSRIAAGKRIGIEIGEAAADAARSRGIEVFDRLASLSDASVDVVMSFHALEHVESPAAILGEMRRVLRPGGRLRIVVPAELATEPDQASWRLNEDMHLFTWTPLLLGNLAQHCGWSNIVTSVEPMPTGSRAVRYTKPLPTLSRAVHWTLARRRNLLNTILNARVPG